MLSGKCLTIYIHSSDETPKQRPQTANQGLPNARAKNSLRQANAPICWSEILRVTCPAASNAD